MLLIFLKTKSSSIEAKSTVISFTIEQEHEGQLAFLDALTRRNGTITIDVYRKPTHRYLDYHSHHDKKHKISTAVTLLHGAATLPNAEEGKTRETKHVTDSLISNGYSNLFQKLRKNMILKKNRHQHLKN